MLPRNDCLYERASAAGRKAREVDQHDMGSPAGLLAQAVALERRATNLRYRANELYRQADVLRRAAEPDRLPIRR